MPKLLAALVLCDVVSHGLKAGAIVEASEGVIKALVKDGSLDANPVAIAHARSNGAPTARSSIEEAAERREAARTRLLAEIAKGEEALKSAKDEATKAALEKDLADQRAALAALTD